MKVCLLGSGIVGLSVAYFLERSGHEVVRIDDNNPQASRGTARIFRLAHQDPFYTKESAKSLKIWNDWEEEWGQRLLVRSGLWISAPWAKKNKIYGHHPLGSRSRHYAVDFAAGTGNIARTTSLLQNKIASPRLHGRAKSITKEGVALEDGSHITGDFIILACGKNTSLLLGRQEAFSHHVRFRYPLKDSSLSCESLPALIDKRVNIYGVQEEEGFALGISDDKDLGFSRTKNLSKHETYVRDAFLKERREKTNRIVSSYFPYLSAQPEDEVYYVHPTGNDGYRLLEQGNILGITGNNLFKFAPLLGKIALEKVKAAEDRRGL